MLSVPVSYTHLDVYKRQRLKSMDLSFEFGCSLNLSFIREKMELADVVCASEEVAKMLAPEEAADVGIMLREQAKIVSGPAESVIDVYKRQGL